MSSNDFLMLDLGKFKQIKLTFLFFFFFFIVEFAHALVFCYKVTQLKKCQVNNKRIVTISMGVFFFIIDFQQLFYNGGNL